MSNEFEDYTEEELTALLIEEEIEIPEGASKQDLINLLLGASNPETERVDLSGDE